MARNSDEHDQLIKDRVEELTWALVDEQIREDELPLLESLLLSDELARHAYIECMQMHSDLISHFARSSANATAKSGTGTQVLGNLNFSTSFDLQSPAGDEARQ
jgi:hypothetical protein